MTCGRPFLWDTCNRPSRDLAETERFVLLLLLWELYVHKLFCPLARCFNSLPFLKMAKQANSKKVRTQSHDCECTEITPHTLSIGKNISPCEQNTLKPPHPHPPAIIYIGPERRVCNFIHYMKCVSMAEQPHTILRSPRAMPSVSWSGV
jgi:hypothetical protein